MKPKYTPGPWIVEIDETGDRSGLEGTVIIDTSNDRIVVAETKYDGEDGHSNGAYPHISQAEANARLIAAAPELLEAAKRALDRMEHYADNLGDADSDVIIEQLTDAIAKATGGG